LFDLSKQRVAAQDPIAAVLDDFAARARMGNAAIPPPARDLIRRWRLYLYSNKRAASKVTPDPVSEVRRA
jgi:hypothetical protein